MINNTTRRNSRRRSSLKRLHSQKIDDLNTKKDFELGSKSSRLNNIIKEKQKVVQMCYF